jgi:hypothetical protein
VPPLPLALPLKPLPKEYENVVSLLMIIENIPFRFRVAGVLLLEFVIGGIPVISTLVGIPGTKPVSAAELAVVTVTVPAV